MVPFAGYEMPVQYEGIIAEHLWTRENAGLFDVSHMGQLFVHGSGVDVALEKIMPGDFQASWAFVLEPRPEGHTRLIERFRGHMEFPDEGPAFAPALASRALLFGLFVMVRRQMHGIRDRAEGRPISHSPWRMFKADIRATAMQAQATAKHGAPTPASA